MLTDPTPKPFPASVKRPELQFALPLWALRRLEQRAAAAGISVRSLARRLLTDALRLANQPPSGPD